MEEKINYYVDPNLPYFEGHFEHNPILPAFITFQIISQAITDKFKLTLSEISWQRIKFLEMIRPGSSLEIILNLEDSKIKVVIKNREQIVFQGHGRANF